MFRRLLTAALAVLLFSATAQAHDYKLGDLTIEHPWARASLGLAKAGAAYLTVVNAGAETDRLIAAATPAAEHAQLHTHLMEDGVMKMRHIEAIEVAPGEPAVLEPGGLHVMMIGLTAPLVAGESFPLTLTFERAGSLEIEVKVEALQMEGDHGDHGEHDSHGDHGDHDSHGDHSGG